MSILNFIKKLIKTKETAEHPRKIALNELGSWVQEKKTESQEEVSNFLNIIQTKTSQLVEELNEKIPTLKKINLNEKKVEERIKFIVKENLDNYTYYLEKLTTNLENLKDLEDPNPNIPLENLNNIFLDFDKKSRTSFEKATFIIGKELGSIRDSIAEFSHNLQKTIKENQILIDNSKIISSTEEKLEKTNKLRDIETEINKNVEQLKKRIEFLNGQIKDSEKDIEEIKQSEEYNKEKETEQEIEENKEQLKKEIYKLKDMIDFKKLTNICHSSEKDMAIIKDYNQNFPTAFEKDDGTNLLKLLDETRATNLNPASQKIKHIIKMRKEIEDSEDNLELEECAKIVIKEKAVKNQKQEIEDSENKISRENKKQEKLQVNKQDVISQIKEKLATINLELE